MRSIRFPLLRRAARLLAVAALLAAAGCDDDGTGPGDRVALTPGQARPFAVVEVQGLPAGYAAAEPAQIQVGGAASLIMYDSVAEVHRFLVPDVAPGRVRVVFPAAGGEREREAELEVLAPAYAGGSPEAALEEMDELADSLQVQTTLAMGVVDRADSVLYPRMAALVQLAEALQDATADLSDADRRAVAAVYSEYAPVMRDLVAFLNEGLVDLRDPDPSLDFASPVFAQAPESPLLASAPRSSAALVTRCLRHVETLRKLDQLQAWATAIVMLANLGTAVAAPAAFPVVALLSAKMMMAFDLAVLIANSAPHLLDPDGLRIQASPRIRHDGGTGDARAFVRRQAAGKIIGAGVGVGGTYGAMAKAVEQLEDIRAMTRMKAVAEVLKDLGLLAVLEVLDRTLSGYIREASGYVFGEVPVTFDAVQITGGTSPRWQFSGAPGAWPRAITTVGRITGPTEDVQLSARMGSGDECGAATSGSAPGDGRNGFQIVTEASLRLSSPAPVELQAGATGTVTVGITNEGGTAASALTYALRDASGAWTAPGWLTVSLQGGPASLAAGGSGSVRISVRAASDAPERSAVIPLSVIQAGKIAATTYATVTVVPQLADVVVNREQSTIRLWDHGTQDGDIVTVTLNGTPLASGLSLTNAGQTFPVRYRRGLNVLVVRAHNEGSLTPNTAALGLADVVRGPGTQQYGLSTGGTAQLTITYDPSAQPSQARSTALPAPTFRRCEAGGSRDCRP